jgi:hypothetical protein
MEGTRNYVQTGSGAQRASYLVGTEGAGALTPKVKTWREHEAGQLPPSSAEVKNEWNGTSISPPVSVAQCSIKNVHSSIMP